MSNHCPHSSECKLFERFRVSSALKVWQVFYCESRFRECSRYIRLEEGKPVEPTLLPDGTTLEEHS
jgi:hypothetical protein